MKTVKLCYCGGCNPRYDRVAAVHALCCSFPEIRFETDGSIRVAVCGCERACVDGEIRLTEDLELQRIGERLKELCAEEGEKDEHV